MSLESLPTQLIFSQPFSSATNNNNTHHTRQHKMPLLPWRYHFCGQTEGHFEYFGHLSVSPNVFMFAFEYYFEMRQLGNFRAAKEVLKELTGSGITQEWRSPWSPRTKPDDRSRHGAWKGSLPRQIKWGSISMTTSMELAVALDQKSEYPRPRQQHHLRTVSAQVRARARARTTQIWERMWSDDIL
jgi:hypothetical protein